MVNTNTFLKDYVIFLRDDIRNNITDPLSGTRPSTESFVYTSYPTRTVSYPIITIKNSNVSVGKMGQQSSLGLSVLDTEIRIWAKDERQKDSLTQDIMNRLRSNTYPQTTSGTSLNTGLFDREIQSAVNVDEAGEGGIKSKVIGVQYSYILGQ